MKEKLEFTNKARDVLETSYIKRSQYPRQANKVEAQVTLEKLIKGGQSTHKEILFWTASIDWHLFLERYFDCCFNLRGTDLTKAVKSIWTPYLEVTRMEMHVWFTKYNEEVVGNHKTVKDFIFSLYNEENVDSYLLDFNRDERMGLYFQLAIGLKLDLDETMENVIVENHSSFGTYYTIEKKWK